MKVLTCSSREKAKTQTWRDERITDIRKCFVSFLWREINEVDTEGHG